jgi:hypothetical protein
MHPAESPKRELLNLNSSNFLRGLYDHLGDDRQDRTLDLLRYGRLSLVQKQERHLHAFNERLEQLRLPLILPDSVVPKKK